MWWLRPIPWARWALSILLIVGALAADLRGPATTPYPFAAAFHPASSAANEMAIEWRDVPAGLLPSAAVRGRLRADIAAGTPLVPELFTPEPMAPPGWWVIDLPLSPGTRAGSEVRVVVLDPAFTIMGVVVGPSESDPFGGETIGPVAVPAASADLVARAAAAAGVVTMVAAGEGQP